MPTMDDVARASGLSRVTVSKVFNGRPVREKSRQRVLKACQQLNFVPNSYATSLARGESRLMGLIVSSITDPFYGQIIATAEQTATDMGFDLAYRCSFARPEQERRIVERFLGLKADALIVSPVSSQANIPFWKALAEELPVVFVDHTTLRACHLIATDHYRGGKLVTEHLLEKHRRPAYLGSTEPLMNSAIAARQRGYEDALRHAGHEPLFVASGPPTAEGDTEQYGYRTMQQYLATLAKKRLPFDALACATDAIALGAMVALAEAGHQPGREVLVAGHDDQPFSSFVTPSLTTVHQPRRGIGERAVTTAVELLKRRGAPGRNVRVRLQPELIARDSTSG